MKLKHSVCIKKAFLNEENFIIMKLLNLFLIFMVNAAQWQPTGESLSHMSHNHDENNVGKA